MSNIPDSAAQIAADMRQLADDIEAGRAIVGQTVWRNYADRVEAVGAGNIAKLRNALELSKVAILVAKKKMNLENPVILEIIDDALAAPPRNCDIYLTEEAVDAATVTVRDCEACSRIDMEAPCVFCMVRWLLAQAQEKDGGAK